LDRSKIYGIFGQKNKGDVDWEESLKGFVFANDSIVETVYILIS
jgi:hypothetical protein